MHNLGTLIYHTNDMGLPPRHSAFVSVEFSTYYRSEGVCWLGATALIYGFGITVIRRQPKFLQKKLGRNFDSGQPMRRKSIRRVIPTEKQKGWTKDPIKHRSSRHYGYSTRPLPNCLIIATKTRQTLERTSQIFFTTQQFIFFSTVLYHATTNILER
jgi:hypothetical protein